MFELGQPIHAFDLSKLTVENWQPQITVRPARKGEKLITIDNAERTLAEGMLLITSARVPSSKLPL